MEKIKPAPSVITIFGATGNLSYSRLLPSLYQLDKIGLLPEKFAVVGAARSKLSSQEYRDTLARAVEKNSRSGSDKVSLEKFIRRVDFYCLDYNKAGDFRQLRKKLDSLEKEWQVCFERVFYLATPPSSFPIIFEQLKKQPIFEFHRGKFHLFEVCAYKDPEKKTGSTFPTLYPYKHSNQVHRHGNYSSSHPQSHQP